MGLLTKNVEVTLISNNIGWYKEKGYTIPKRIDKKGRFTTPKGSIIIVKVEDLPLKSTIRVNVKCDCEDCKNPYLKSIAWQDYLKCVKDDGKYYCRKCAKKLYGDENARKTRLKNSDNSFYKWCIEHNQQDILDRWDYKLNDLDPNEISCGSVGKNRKGYWFKCPRGLHPSELKSINDFVKGHQGSMNCTACNSFAQWGIDNICHDFLEQYWSEKNTVNPWEISHSSNKKVWVKCQEDIIHGSYNTMCNNFTKINGSRCPICNQSKGEKRIENYLINNNFVKDIDYIPQKEFEGLIGINNGNLSYDFYLFKSYNLLIEYQGEMHEKFIKGIHKTKKDFEKQVEHDNRKKQYAIDNKIKLLEIWYWDFDNVESILKKELM